MSESITKNWINDLHHIQEKTSRTIVGTMSGTSIDGLDVAVCRFTGWGIATKFEVLHHGTVEYSDSQASILRRFATEKMIDMQELTIYHAELSYWHAEMISKLLTEWNLDSNEIDLLASHGQTVRHAPRRIHQLSGLPNSTFQLGDGDHLARLTGLITVHDFRQKHVATGGEGAPLAGYGDRILFSGDGNSKILLNVGGISNITVLDVNDSDGIPLTFDTGPGNTLMDHVVRGSGAGVRYDEGGRIAALGQVSMALLNSLKSHQYFAQSPPKTTGPEAFSPQFLLKCIKESGCGELTLEDMLATLNRFTAETIAEAIQSCSGNLGPIPVYISGGGAHNATLISNLRQALGHHAVHDFSLLGVDPDAKEAVFFAALANECIMGSPVDVPQRDGTFTKTVLGKISFPH
jgi:anhydro-N-acetylmuramic acid kinase